MFHNLQIIYNYTVPNEKEEQEILAAYEEAGKALESLPHFEVKEINRQSANDVDVGLCGEDNEYYRDQNGSVSLA